ncbi:MAG TPA: class I SAM-dependent methyltransferase [Ignavibacteriaceae bacterium]|nr:class I SAM-dependent methyltransferase [Ignavibacteriaceae bacterium]
MNREISNSYCSACNHKMVNCGNIQDGVLYKCRYCGSKRVYSENLGHLNDKNGYGNSYREKISPLKVQELIELFNKHFTYADKNIGLLDIGFGMGDFLISVSQRGLLVSGLEYDINSVKFMQRKNIQAYFGELGGDMKLDRLYDVVTLWDVIEHIPDIEKAMLQLNSILKENGKIFILTPNSDSTFDTLADIERKLTFHKSQRIMNICLNRYHVHRFSVTGLKILLDRFGFIVDHVQKLQLFSLKKDTYMNGFAPGIKSWTNNTSFNKFLSISAMTLIKSLNITNKIFITAIKT